MVMLWFALAALGGIQDTIPPAQREFRAAWVATVDNIDWPSRRGLPMEEQQRELTAIFDLASKMKLNAIVFQVRPSADALYTSRHEPWSEFITGVQGQNPGWDPLEFAVRAAHERGMELHAWINPLRAWHPAHKGQPSKNHVTVTNRDWVVNYGNQKWMDPGHPGAQKRALDVAADLLKRYDLDGLHIDDYFYPYPVRDSAGKPISFPDDKTYKSYQASGGAKSRDDWRRSNCDSLVKGLYDVTRRVRPHAKFGVSPFGIARPGVPKGIEAGIDQFAELYADPVKWLQQGWLDYLTPQLYWPIAQTKQSYPVLLDWWNAQNTKHRHLWVGNYASQLIAKAEWTSGELVSQIELTRKSKASGNIHFSFKALAKDAKGIQKALEDGPYRELALVPISSWLDAKRPAPPSFRKRATGEIAITGTGDTARIACYERREGKWRLVKVLPNSGGTWKPTAPAAISALDRAWNESSRVLVGER